MLALAVLVMAVEWILLVAGLKRDEMIVGALSIVTASTFLYVVYGRETQRLDLRLTDLAACWRIPWYILSDAWVITRVLIKDLLSIQRAGSYFRVCGFRTAKEDPLLVARRVLATAYTTMTPNSIVIGIDYEQSRMLFHQLERSSVSKMTQELGTQR
jgi:hypothetical protein